MMAMFRTSGLRVSLESVLVVDINLVLLPKIRPASIAIMRRYYLIFAIQTFLLLSWSNSVLANYLTPFVETASVGEIKTGWGWLVALDTLSYPERKEEYIFLVLSDRTQYYPLYAIAEKGVVSEKVLGKRMDITAKVLDKKLEHRYMNLFVPIYFIMEILGSDSF